MRTLRPHVPQDLAQVGRRDRSRRTRPQPAAPATTWLPQPTQPGALPAPLRALGNWLPPAVLLLLLAGQLVLPDGWSALGWLPVTLGLLLGLPHGAVDHLVPAWVRARRTPLLGTVGLLTGYLATATVMFAVFRRYPLPALLLFLVASGLHFGVGEVQYDRLRQPTRPSAETDSTPAGGRARGVGVTAVAVLAWGGTSVLLPLACWPSQVRGVLEALAPGSGRLLLAPAARHAAVILVTAAAALTVLRAVRQRRYRPALELTLLVTVFVVVPPLVAFAGYFGAWHSVRHIVRLLAVDPANAAELSAGQLTGPLRRFARSASWPTAAALLALLALLAVTRGAHSLLAADLALAALTAPHMLLVAWLDRQTRLAPARPAQPRRAGSERVVLRSAAR